MIQIASDADNPPLGNPGAAIPLRAATPRGPRPLPFELPEEGELPVAIAPEKANTTQVRTVDASATKSVVRRSPPPLEGVYQPPWEWYNCVSSKH